MTDTIAEVDFGTGRMVVPLTPRAWEVVYGDRLEHSALFHDRGAAERASVTLRGQILALVWQGVAPGAVSGQTPGPAL